MHKILINLIFLVFTVEGEQNLSVKILNFNKLKFKKKADLRLLNNSLYNLQNKLFEGYNAFIRPVKNPNQTTFINIDLTLLQLISMVI